MSALDRKAKAALWRNRATIVAKIQAAVADEYGLKVGDLLGRNREIPKPEARREVMVRLWLKGLSLSEVGRLLGVDHSYVHDSCVRAFGDQYAAMSPGAGRTPKSPPIVRHERDAAE